MKTQLSDALAMIEAKIRDARRLSASNPEFASRLCFEISELSANLGALLSEDSALQWCRTPGDCYVPF